jgi:YfiH family protein
MQKITHPNGVVYYKSDKIKTTHAFATRLGGVSTHEHTRSLNLAFGRGDDEATVLENLRRFAEAVGFSAESVVSMPQIHSDKVINVTSSMCGEGYFIPNSTECDGYVTRDKGVSIGVRTADCVPILLEDAEAGVVAALHAGWRGTFSDICGEGVRKMIAKGADASRIVAAIGPSICQNCYEVGKDVYDAAISCMGADASRFFVSKSEEGKYLVNIKGANKYLLERAGLVSENIEILDLCTYEHPELFWSHRYTCGMRGTMLSVIML